MKKAPGFVAAQSGASLPVGVALLSDEDVVGWYVNPRPWSDSLIVFTTAALHIVDSNKQERIPFEEIVGYESPPQRDPVGVRLLTHDGFRFVRIAGSSGPHGNQKDAFCLVMAIRGMIPPGKLIVHELSERPPSA
jgi:hypothetical protein